MNKEFYKDKIKMCKKNILFILSSIALLCGRYYGPELNNTFGMYLSIMSTLLLMTSVSYNVIKNVVLMIKTNTKLRKQEYEDYKGYKEYKKELKEEKRQEKIKGKELDLSSLSKSELLELKDKLEKLNLVTDSEEVIENSNNFHK